MNRARALMELAFAAAGVLVCCCALIALIGHAWGFRTDIVASWIQAVGSLAAVYAAIYVATSERRRRSRANDSLKTGITSIARRTVNLLKQIRDGSLYRAASVISFVDAEANYRATVSERAQALLNVISLIPIDRLAESRCLEAVLYLRDGIEELSACFSQCVLFAHLPADESMGQLRNALNFVDLAMQELGLENSGVVDMSRTVTGQSHEQSMPAAGMMVETDIHGHRRTRPIVS